MLCWTDSDNCHVGSKQNQSFVTLTNRSNRRTEYMRFPLSASHAVSDAVVVGNRFSISTRRRIMPLLEMISAHHVSPYRVNSWRLQPPPRVARGDSSKRRWKINARTPSATRNAIPERRGTAACTRPIHTYLVYAHRVASQQSRIYSDREKETGAARYPVTDRRKTILFAILTGS